MDPLPRDHPSLALGAPPGPPGTLCARALGGGLTLRPGEGREVLFGRNRDHVHVCVGGDDWRVSRLQGVVTHRERQWWLRNTGRLPLRLPGSLLLFTQEEPVPLAEGYTPLFVRGSAGREHLLELYVTGPEGRRAVPHPGDPTQPPRTWPLADDERLALIVLGQRYLLHEASPQPLTWKEAAAQLEALRPGEGWSAKKLAHKVARVRERLSRGGVAGLTEAEVPQPVGNALNDNLLRELLLTTTLVPPDLAVLDGGTQD
ncbi:FHA domain-containing protein [Streptomyces sp. DSM 44917]|uniref:FHA domain-containing protein n=1 Tax=Streptomyces boetiae TaxID=3075541 RepID=A0ABU2L622_9ACTN|nr:FHA domain-containing protein [Streptomyces sp. DSM 44917]MDT0307010.1 FHA domain-containing protein [Streptomyces sp. DSM 44917]